MRHICLFIIMGLMAGLHPAFGQEEAPAVFFEALYDVPVMAGLEEVPELSMNFDKLDGRISQAGAVAKTLTKDQILAFYAAALPQMGWSKIQLNQYDREKEQLFIVFEEMTEGLDQSILVKFMLQPAQK